MTNSGEELIIQLFTSGLANYIFIAICRKENQIIFASINQ